MKDLGLFCLEKRRLEGALITVLQCFKGIYKEDRGFLFTRSYMEKTRPNEYKLYQERLLGEPRPCGEPSRYSGPDP